jgi:hypothetical protein
VPANTVSSQVQSSHRWLERRSAMYSVWQTAHSNGLSPTIAGREALPIDTLGADGT